jgi:hypothetical protein
MSRSAAQAQRRQSLHPPVDNADQLPSLRRPAGQQHLSTGFIRGLEQNHVVAALAGSEVGKQWS